RPITLMKSARGHRRLHLRQLGDDEVCERLEAFIAGAGVYQGERREVVTDAGPRELNGGRLPSTEGLRVRLETRRHAKGVQQPIGVEREQELLVPHHRVAERTVEQADFVERKRT